MLGGHALQEGLCVIFMYLMVCCLLKQQVLFRSHWQLDSPGGLAVAKAGRHCL
jgi:hypothetical protein